MLRTPFILLVSCIGYFCLHAQNEPLNQYIDIALANNLSLKQQSLIAQTAAIKIGRIEGKLFTKPSISSKIFQSNGWTNP